MKKWEFDVPDLHGLKNCKIEVSDQLKWKIQKDPELKNIVNLCWAIYIRNAPIWMTIPIPESFGIKEIIFHHSKGTINIS